MNASIEKQYDVCVVGGGLAGCAAAIAAAESGASTVLIEESGILGGQATLGLVTPLSAVRSNSREAFGGLCRSISEEISRVTQKYCIPRGESRVNTIQPHMTKYVLLKRCLQANVAVMFHARLVEAECLSGGVHGVTIHTESGFGKIVAKAFVDGTGDGDLVAQSGAGFLFGSEQEAYDLLREEGLLEVHYTESDQEPETQANTLQPVSIFFKMRGVNVDAALKWNNVHPTYADLGTTKEQFMKEPYFGACGFEENGELVPLPQQRILVSRGNTEDTAVINMSRVVKIDGSDSDSLNRGEALAQMQVLHLVDFLIKYVPGFENAYFTESAVTLGVRETRRMRGQYVLSGADVIRCRSFADAVARGSYMIDIHDPTGKNSALGGELKGDYYEIPLRCLASADYPNLFAAGRCISADHVAHSSTRIQGTCLQTGEAAGVAAAELALTGAYTAESVRTELIRRGATL